MGITMRKRESCEFRLSDNSIDFGMVVVCVCVCGDGTYNGVMVVMNALSKCSCSCCACVCFAVCTYNDSMSYTSTCIHIYNIK